MIFYKHVLSKSEPFYNQLALRRWEFPDEIFQMLPSMGSEVIVTDYNNDIIVYAHLNKRGWRIDGLHPIWKYYKEEFKEGDIIGVAIYGNNIYLNFELGKKINDTKNGR